MPQSERAVEVRTRAEPMAPDQRRAMIVEAAIPLFLEHGPTLTTRQLADWLGIAEGTIFRAFGDKDALVRAVVDRFFEKAREQMAQGLVDPALPLQQKVEAVVAGSRTWMHNVMTMMSLLRHDHTAPDRLHRSLQHPPREDEYRTAIAAAFAPDAAELRVDLDQLGAFMRIAGIAAGAARRAGGTGLTDDDLVQFILYGIAGVPREGD